MQQRESEIISIKNNGDISAAIRAVKKIAESIGFGVNEMAAITLAVRELATNITKYAVNGVISINQYADSDHAGIQIESRDLGPGIRDVELAMADGYSSNGSLGCGLGTVNRAMDEFTIISEYKDNPYTHITCKKWKDSNKIPGKRSPLSIGAASRPHPHMKLNGDSFVIKQWETNALIAVIDGLGHGQFAHHAAEKARQYIETHYTLPIEEIFRGTGRNCYATRGVVMSLVRIDWELHKMWFAGIGNVTARVFGGSQQFKYIIRRGIIGKSAPKPVITEHIWESGTIMVIHTDGLKTHWQWEDHEHLSEKPAPVIAHGLLSILSKNNDDATAVVIKEDTV